ncbi:MAG: SDR family NAD(P)-dependent oxidoreductase [Candidatus Adiutrix sp.]|jgi:3-oxoacyl-(acyl-carrier-protein) synthase/acyl carrier protein/NAD(P)-dependent dehydrogenase (short-subunit alcohol dehydrogenase family)|nr:SDR family NAD(P)-dependent oxidoreductase [Candidatus Adiutrix sp.]
MTQDCSDDYGKSFQPVAIIGLSCLFPGSAGLAAFWAAIKSGRDAIGDIPADHWSPADYYNPDPTVEDMTYGRRGGFLAPVAFEPLKYGIAPNDLSAIDTTQLLGLVGADQALRDAGYPAEGQFNHDRTAVLIGLTGALKMVVGLGSRLVHPQIRRALADSGVDEDTAREVLKRFANEFAPWKKNSFPGLLGNVTAGRIANRLNLGGANLVVDAACASSLAAIRHGLMELAAHQADLVVTGGIDTFSDPFMYTCFSKTPALSPTGDIRAYDQEGDGTILGEGMGLVVLKRLAEARRDGDRIYAVILSVGSASDGKGTAVFAPSAEGQRRALANAYETAGLDPGQVGLVEGHGTGTSVGDTVEVEALNQAFSRSERAAAGRPWCALGSVKSQIGHTKAAAGAAGLIKSALALHYKTLPPTAKVKNPLPAITASGSPFYLSSRPRPWLAQGPRRAGVSAFGFGGSNYHCVLEEAEPGKAAAAVATEIWAFSGDSLADILGRLSAVAASSQPGRAAQSCREFSAQAEARLIMVASEENFAALAGEVRPFLTRPGLSPDDVLENVFFGSGPAQAGGLGFLWPGPEALRANEFLELAADWPEMFGPLNEAAAELAVSAPELAPLDLALYPPDLASPEMIRGWAADLADPRLRSRAAQALACGLTAVLARFGLTPAASLTADPNPETLVRELKAQPAIGLWLELGGSGQLSRAVAEAGARVLPLPGEPGGHLELARCLGRLAAWGWPVDFTAWPGPSPEPETEKPAGNLTVMITGANTFEKKEIPPMARPSAPVETRGGVTALSALETLTAETARLHQIFLNQQAEALRLVQSELAAKRVSEAPAPVAATPKTAYGPALSAETLRRVVAGETGYPVEMLNLDMNLESDLGLDSIKKVEIMAVLSEKWPDLQGLGAEALSGATTLRDLANLLGLVEPGVSAPAAPVGGRVWPILREVVATETGYPLEMLSPEMRLGDDLGLDSIKLVEIASVMSERLPASGPLGADLLAMAETLGELAQALDQTPDQTGTPPAASGSADREAETILEVVARETGYPRAMLAREMKLEADLGLDSIKKVEIMAALSERLPQLEALASAEVLSGLETLGDLVALADRKVQPTGQPSDQPALQPLISRPAPTLSPGDLLLEVVAAETGYPREMLTFEAGLESDLGLDSIKRVEIMAVLSERLGDDRLTAGGLGELLGQAATLGDLRDILTQSGHPATRKISDQEDQPLEIKKRRPGRPPKNSSPTFQAERPEMTLTTGLTSFRVIMVPVPAIAGPSAGLPVGARLLLLAESGPLAQALVSRWRNLGYQVERFSWSETEGLKNFSEIHGLILVWPGSRNELSLPRQAFQALKNAGSALLSTARASRPPLVMSLTFMGGSFGLNGGPITAPISAALPGLVKTAAREWAGVRARALDLPEAAYGPEADSYFPAIMAGAELAGPVEIGLAGPDQFLAPKLEPYRLKNIRVRHLRAGQTILVTGGARGVTAAALKELARSSTPHLVILGRTSLTSPEPGWLEGLKDESALRQAIFDRSGGKIGPQELARESRRLLTNREIRNNLAEMEKAGARVTYISGDYLNPAVLSATLSRVKRDFGPIQGFIHGAGVLADSLILDKTEDDFDRVFNTKAQLADQILSALAGQPLNLVALFSSSTARFGRRGQADYAAGNEVLNKLALALAGNRPGPKCLSVNWGPWDGGMVQAGLKHLFAEEGVGLIPQAEGARMFTALAGAPKNDPVEVVVLGPATDLTALE